MVRPFYQAPMTISGRKLRYWPHLATLLLLASACSSSESADAKPTWSCWLGSHEANICSCYPDKLEPFAGSPPIGTSCAQSRDTDFLCCTRKAEACDCYYRTDYPEIDERDCGAVPNKVFSCP